MAKHSSRSPSDETGPTRRAKAKRASVAAKPSLSTLATTSSWAVKCARGARRRRHVPRRCWAELTYGLAGVIAEHTLANDVSDYMSFRSVCREWRRGTEDDAPRTQGCLDRRFHPRRWIMLREAVPPSPGRHRRRFLNVSTGQCVQTELPELDGHHLLGATTEGLLALLDKSTHVVRVLNPITRQLAELPSLEPLLPPETRTKFSEGGLAYGFKVTGLGLDGDSTMALCVFDPKMLVAARPGDDCWTLVEGEDWFYSAIAFSGRFYCVNGKAVMALDATTANKPPQLVVAAKLTFPVSLLRRDTLHLVESGGRLLLLRRQLAWRGEYNPWEEEEDELWIREYKVYEVDLAAQETVAVPVPVFLGGRHALSVSLLVFPSIRADRVYPAATSWEKMEEGIDSYNLLDGSIERCKVRVIRRMHDDDGGFDGGWARPCGIDDYLSWYVSPKCNAIEEI